MSDVCKDITIVTAYFNVIKEKGQFITRSTDDYIDYFKKWAKLKNKFVVFVENDDIKNKIIKFRSDLGLADKTTVIVINNIYDIAPSQYQMIENTVKNEILRKYRFSPNNPESINPLYNYVMMLKAWCIAYTAETLKIKGQLAWVDFGFNHGGKVYSLKTDFNVLWDYDFGDKITFFNLKPLDNRPIFDIVFSMDTYIMGSIIVVPDNLASMFWNIVKDFVEKLSDVGIADDDQILWLMCYRKMPEMFTIKGVKGWHTAMKEYGCNTFMYNEIKKDTIMRKFVKKIKLKIKAVKYCKSIYSVASNWIPK